MEGWMVWRRGWSDWDSVEREDGTIIRFFRKKSKRFAYERLLKKLLQSRVNFWILERWFLDE